MSTRRTAPAAGFGEEDALRRRLTRAWLATGTVPVAYIVADPETSDDASIDATGSGATPPTGTIVQWFRVALKAKIPVMYTRTSA